MIVQMIVPPKNEPIMQQEPPETEPKMCDFPPKLSSNFAILNAAAKSDAQIDQLRAAKKCLKVPANREIAPCSCILSGTGSSIPIFIICSSNTRRKSKWIWTIRC